MSRIRTGLVTGLLATAAVVLAPALPAAAAPAAGPVLKVEIKTTQVRLLADGSVRVPLRAKCASTLDAFEVDLSVTQGSVVGQNNTVGGAFPACTGKWQSTTLVVVADSGTFGPGRASIGVFLGAFDQEEGDLSAEDSATVGLRACH